jgi:hypothetical protein
MQKYVKILFILFILVILSIIIFFSAYDIQTYQEPTYKILYSGKLTYSVLGQVVDEYSFTDATSFNLEKFGLAYRVKVCYDSQCTTHLANGGYDEIQSYPSQIVIGNETICCRIVPISKK